MTDRPAPHPVRGLLGACHPLPAAAVTVIAVLLALGVGLGPGSVALFGAAVLTGQLSIGWSNDRIDAARDRATGRRDKPAAQGAVSARVLTVAAGLSLLAAVALSLALGWRAGLVALVLVAAGWAYNLGLKSTIWSGPAYLIGFAALPAAAYLALPTHPAPPWWTPLTGALLGLGAHLANVLPDLRADAATGVRGLPHRLGSRAGGVLLALVLAAASMVIVLGSGNLPTWLCLPGAAIGLACAGLGLRRPDSPLAFRATLVVALVDVVLFVLAA
ncbi:MAG TPA: UbiA family prenyltransferase [Pseudonocardiaceae bacterium]|nr:UbiA family prenyltransferase [Pseudonocardiaceae bacterium]